MANTSRHDRIAPVLDQDQDQDAREALAEELLDVVDCVIAERLGLKRAGGPYVGLPLRLENIVRIIDAAGVPLAGRQPWFDDWPAVDGNRWCSAGAVHQIARNREPLAVPVDETPAARAWRRGMGTLRVTQELYTLDDDGALVRTAVFDPLLALDRQAVEGVDMVTRSWDRSPVLVRQPGEQRPVTLDEGFGAMAALLGAVAPLHLSLTRAVDKRVVNRVAKVMNDVRDLAHQLSRPELAILRHQGSEAFEVLCDGYAGRFGDVHELLQSSEKQSEPMIKLMAPAVACFQLLFRPVTRTPFSRFVVAFLRELGCDYEPDTVSRNLVHWRNDQAEAGRPCAPRVHRQNRKKRSRRPTA